MIADLKPYPAMRDSGVVWLGEVPKGWDVLRGRQLFEIKKRISGELGHPVISVTQEGLRVKDVESGEGQLSQDYSKYQTVGVGEFAMNSMDLLTGGVGIATRPGVTSPDYRVFAIRDESRCCDRYMLHVLRMLYRNRGFYAWGQGSAQLGRWRLPRKRFNDFPFPVPPFTEQAAIARFLDWANGRLERAIRAKRKVIALLNEQKQAIINRAVTRGLDPSVPLKPSGIPWLGDIPAHWEVKPLKHWTKINSHTLGEATDPDFEFRYIDISAVETGRLVREPEEMCFKKAPSRARRILTVGDTIVSTVRTYLKAVWFVGKDAEKLIASTGFAVFSPNLDVEPEYLHYVLQDTSFVNQVSANSVGIAYPAIAESVLAQFHVAIPSSRKEQGALITAIKSRTQPIITAISRLEREIELIREYRTRLVADVVTGKLDVRQAAARLPEEAPRDIAEDDTDLTEEIESADEGAAV